MPTGAPTHQRILIVQGHPDASVPHFGHALAQAYAEGARAAGHEVHEIEVARLGFPWLRSKADWDHGPMPTPLAALPQEIRWSTHLLVVYPLWLGGMPAVLKAFLEQLARPDVALSHSTTGHAPRQRWAGRSARIVVTMGMPAWVYRWYFGAHSLKALKRSILGFAGVAPIADTLIGSIDALSPQRRDAWLRTLARLGRDAR